VSFGLFLKSVTESRVMFTPDYFPSAYHNSGGELTYQGARHTWLIKAFVVRPFSG
jgi:hypothetical protein